MRHLQPKLVIKSGFSACLSGAIALLSNRDSDADQNIAHLGEGVADADCRCATHSIQGQLRLGEEFQLVELLLRRRAN